MSIKGFTVSGAITIALLGLFPLSGAAQGGLGSLSATGPVLVDGQTASGSVSLAATNRLATGDGGGAVVTLASGGELRLAAQTDAIVSTAGNRLNVHLLCGEVQLTSTSPAAIISASGGRITSVSGDSTVVAGGRNERLKRGKSSEFSGNVMLTAGGAGSSVTVISGRRCDCGCGSAFGGRP
jgi:ferric-dicitrate binding protein FerR (iron transport regulator)